MHSIRHKTALSVVAVFIAAWPSFAHGQAQQAVSVSLPETVVLHYFGSIDLSFDAAGIRALLLAGVGDTVDEGSSSVIGFTGDLGIDLVDDVVIGPANPQRVPLELENAFAVRGLSNGGRLRVTGSFVSRRADHTSAAAARITANQLELEIDGERDRRLAFDAPGLVNPALGSIHMELDLRRATVGGEYAGIQIRLVAETL